MKLHKDILNNKERLELLRFVKTKVMNLGDTFPGLQTKPNLHTYKEMNVLLDRTKKYYAGYIIDKCWANYSIGDYLSWHTHPNHVSQSMVYFLQNPNNMGPFFKENKLRIRVTRCPENSLILFSAQLQHSVPCHLEAERYSIAFDLVATKSD